MFIFTRVHQDVKCEHEDMTLSASPVLSDTPHPLSAVE